MARRRRLRRLLVAVLVAGIVASAATPARATGPYGFSPPFFYPDSADYWYCFANVPAGDQYRFHSATDYLEASSVMYDLYTPTCAASTDAEFWYGSHWSGGLGYSDCVAQTGPFGVMCDRWRVWIDASLISASSSAGFYDFNMHHIIRHEIGHTMGQHHPGGINAMSSTINSYNLNYLNYLGHEVSCHVDRFLNGLPIC